MTGGVEARTIRTVFVPGSCGADGACASAVPVASSASSGHPSRASSDIGPHPPNERRKIPEVALARVPESEIRARHGLYFSQDERAQLTGRASRRRACALVRILFVGKMRAMSTRRVLFASLAGTT